MAVKHTPTGIVHQGKKGSQTGCGFDTRKEATHWTDSHSKITCDKNGQENGTAIPLHINYQLMKTGQPYLCTLTISDYS